MTARVSSITHTVQAPLTMKQSRTRPANVTSTPSSVPLPTSGSVCETLPLAPLPTHILDVLFPVADVFPLAPALVANVAIVPDSPMTRRAVFRIQQALKKFCSTSCCIRLGTLLMSVGLHIHISQGRCCPPSPSAYARPSEARMTTRPRA